MSHQITLRITEQELLAQSLNVTQPKEQFPKKTQISL